MEFVAGLLKSRLFWILLGASVLVGCGWKVKAVFDQRAELKAELEALKAAKRTGLELQETANAADEHVLTMLRAEKGKSDARAKDLETQLRTANANLASCRVKPGTLRVLNRTSEGPAVAEAAGGDRSGAPAVETGPGSTCAAVVTTFDENHGLFDAMRTQLNACRAFYKDVRTKYCAATQACE